MQGEDLYMTQQRDNMIAHDTQEDITPLMNNINSIRRESLGSKSPYEATTDKSIFRLMELMGLHRIPAEEINLTPTLLKI